MARRRTNRETLTADLFDPSPQLIQDLRQRKNWPESERFPLNHVQRDNVGARIRADLKQSRYPLIVTGYASLAEIVDLTSDMEEASRSSASTRLLFGAEPFSSSRRSFSGAAVQLPREMREYWLNKGISLTLSAELLTTIQALKERRVIAHYVDEYPTRLHAKIYIGEYAATLGSSNFTGPGLQRNIEANVRFESTGDEAHRYKETKQIAENLWCLGRNFNESLIELLERLLKWATWQEALARACAELLEGEWARAYTRFQMFGDETPLWPSQINGIARALFLIDRVGSVLIADPTGSGKTRMGAYLLRAVMNRIWASGRMRKGISALVAPPAIMEDWHEETLAAHLTPPIYSHGDLSHAGSKRHAQVLQGIRQAQVLAVDEAHNFLNLAARRTQRLLGNIADHLVLFTATPINRSARDLMRLVDMLGADNFEESTVKAVEALYRQRHLGTNLSRNELQHLQREIQKFTVRRTKAQLTELIDREPNKYRDRNGRVCRYPEHVPRTYQLDETKEDCRIADDIRELTGNLVGATYFQSKIELPMHLRIEGWTDTKYLETRLRAAQKLASYNIMNALRSSRAALYEHIHGTAAATEFAKLATKPPKHDTGNQLEKLDRIAGRVPEIALKHADPPAWLTDSDIHADQCRKEAKIYERISELVKRLTDRRERRKAIHLASLLDRHKMIIAFDSKPISLSVIADYLSNSALDAPIWLATGTRKSDRDKVQKAFKPSSDVDRAIALCSDSLSESVNLQRASSVVHLDMPSVVRVAEQRVGRVDRLDSPHKTIEAWWPEDAPAFALRRDERFFQRFDTVESLIGANMPLPQSMVDRWHENAAEPIRPAEMLATIREAEEEEWNAWEDAFDPVRQLIDGQTALISDDTYHEMREEAAKVLSRVSAIPAKQPWAFFCIRGSKNGAPQWVLMNSPNESPETDLSTIALRLRELLGPNPENLPPDRETTKSLNEFLTGLAHHRRALLSPKKRRLLDGMEDIVRHYYEMAMRERNQVDSDFLIAVLRSLRASEDQPGPDLSATADAWMDLIRPLWFKKLRDRRRTRPLRLADLDKDLKSDSRLSVAEIQKAFTDIPPAKPIQDQIAACILGVPITE